MEAKLVHANGVKHQRRLTYVPGAWLHVHDRLQSSIPHTFRQWFHFGEDAEYYDSRLRYGEQTIRILNLEEARFEVHRGATNPLRGWRASDQLGALVPATSVALVQAGCEVVFNTYLALDESFENAAKLGSAGPVIWRLRG